MIDLIAHVNSKSPVAEAYRTIRTNIRFSGVDKPLKSIVVTSATPNEGKSTVIANLAVVLAQAGNKVILLDCDLRNPTQHKLFELENKGLSNCIAMGKAVAELTQDTPLENLKILCAGPIAPNPSELLCSQALLNIFESLREDYDYILVDAPPVLPVTDAAVLASKLDAVIQVVAANQVSPDEAKVAKQRLEQVKANIIGVVLNRVDVRDSRGGYGYYYYYVDK